MQQVYGNIFIGDQSDCKIGLCMKPKHSVIHCVKDPCHSRMAGTRKTPKDDPHYLAIEYAGDLFLNMIDPPQPLFQPGTFEAFMDFMQKHKDDEQILVHCNKGGSRAPSLVMLWLAKNDKLPGYVGRVIEQSFLDDEEKEVLGTYDQAADAMKKLYPAFQPGEGIQTYMREHWDEL